MIILSFVNQKSPRSCEILSRRKNGNLQAFLFNKECFFLSKKNSVVLSHKCAVIYYQMKVKNATFMEEIESNRVKKI